MSDTITTPKTDVQFRQFYNWINSSFSQLFFYERWCDAFIDYMDHHVMADVRARLTAGMDEDSIEYVKNHDSLIYSYHFDKGTLYRVEKFWTKCDAALIKKYKEAKASGTNPLLSKVDQSWGSTITSIYGLYDADKFVPGLLGKINGRAVIEGGAFTGDTVTIWRMNLPQSPIHAFEPSTPSFERLQSFLSAEIAKGNVIANKKGLGSEQGILMLKNNDMHDEVADPGASLKMDYQGSRCEEVEVITLDSYADEHQLDVGLIKLDVEGFAPEVIMGAVNTIKRCRPVMLISCYHTPEEFYEIRGFIESLNLNYHFEFRRTSINMPLYDLALIAYPL